MKIESLSIGVAIVVALASCPLASAATIVRDGSSPNNVANLNLGTGWIGGTAPTSSDIASFWSTAASSTTMPTAVLGGNLSWDGITVDTNDFASGTVISSDGNTLTLGASGLVNTGSRNARFDNAFILASNQTWSNTTTNSQITIGGNVDTAGYTLSLLGRNKRFSGVISGSGGLNISGSSGTVITLEGLNTYSGDTIVDQRQLTLADNAQLSFYIGASGTNNRIAGVTGGAVGTLQLDGDFKFDLTSAAITFGSAWEIIDMDSDLAVTFGSTFSVLGFTEASPGLWSGNYNGTDYLFTEASGMLSVVPEPFSLSLIVFAGGVLFILRRRARSTPC